MPPPSDKPLRRRALRAERAAFVAGLDPGTRAALEAALAVQALPGLRGAAIIAAYHACGDEIDPAQLVAMLRQRGTIIAYPRVADNAATLNFHACRADELVAGFKGIMEPPLAAAAVLPDTMLVPLVGIDLAGNRIGQGAGHYDRSLETRPVRTLGLAWEVQIVDAIAPDPWDRRLDALATPARMLRFAD